MGYLPLSLVRHNFNQLRAGRGTQRLIQRYVALQDFINHQDIERFSDLLDITIVNFKEYGLESELSSRSLYARLLSKLPESLLTNFNRHLFEKSLPEKIESLKGFINLESEFRTQAFESVKGVKNIDSGKSRTGHTMFTNRENYPACPCCSNEHGVWNCTKFKGLGVNQRWELAKTKNMCFRCLGLNHRGGACYRSKECGINRCKKNHHRLLHQDSCHTKKDVNKTEKAPVSTPELSLREKPPSPTPHRKNKPSDSHAEQSLTTLKLNSNDMIALRTVPVKFKNGNSEIVVNALLDDASTKTYVSRDVATELNLQGVSETINVSVINGHTEVPETCSVDLIIESLA